MLEASERSKQRMLLKEVQTLFYGVAEPVGGIGVKISDKRQDADVVGLEQRAFM